MMQDGEFDVRQSSRETHGGGRERNQSVEADEKGGRRSEGEGTGCDRRYRGML